MLPAAGLETAALAGIGVGGVVFLVLLMILVVILVKTHKNMSKRNKAAARAEQDENPVYGLYECDADPQVDKQKVLLRIQKITIMIHKYKLFNGISSPGGGAGHQRLLRLPL